MGAERVRKGYNKKHFVKNENYGCQFAQDILK